MRHSKGYGIFPLGNALQRARRAAGFTHEELAAEMGIPLAALRSLEFGEVPNREELRKMEATLGDTGACRTYLEMARRARHIEVDPSLIRPMRFQ